MEGKGGQLAQGCPWSLPSRGVRQGPRLQDPHQETRLSRKGLHSIGQVHEGSQGGEERLSLALPRRWGLELIFGTVYTVSTLSILGGRGGAARERKVSRHGILFLQPWVSFPLHRDPLAMVRIPGTLPLACCDHRLLGDGELG